MWLRRRLEEVTVSLPDLDDILPTPLRERLNPEWILAVDQVEATNKFDRKFFSLRAISHENQRELTEFADFSCVKQIRILRIPR